MAVSNGAVSQNTNGFSCCAAILCAASSPACCASSSCDCSSRLGVRLCVSQNSRKYSGTQGQSKCSAKARASMVLPVHSAPMMQISLGFMRMLSSSRGHPLAPAKPAPDGKHEKNHVKQHRERQSFVRKQGHTGGIDQQPQRPIFNKLA